MNLQRFATRILPIACLAMGATAVTAQITTIQPTARGWLCDGVNTPCGAYGQPGVVLLNDGAAPTNNIFAGSAVVPNDQGQTFNAGVYRNWFTFAIPKLSAPLVSAYLTLPEPNRWNSDTHTYSVYGLTAQPQVFADVKGTPATLLGTVTTTGTSIGTIVLLNFNTAGLAAITAAQGGNLYLGGIDGGETLGGYHGDFSGTGLVGVDFPPYPALDRRTPLVLNTSPFATTHTGYCTTPPTTINSFTMEHVQDVTKIQSTLNAVIPAATVGQIFSGQYEVRSKITYSSVTNIFNDDIFLVAAGAPLPTPDSFPILNSRFAFVTGPVDKIYTNCTPYASAMLVGRYTAGQPLYGSPVGAPFAFSFGYNTADPDPNFRFRDLAFVSSGIGTTYEGYAYGSISLPPPAAVGPPQTNLPTIVLNPALTAGSVTQVLNGTFTVDASGSTDPSGLPLSYQWSSTNPVTFSPGSTATAPLITFQSGSGDYPITLVVSNSAGITSTITFTLEYLKGRR